MLDDVTGARRSDQRARRRQAAPGQPPNPEGTFVVLQGASRRGEVLVGGPSGRCAYPGMYGVNRLLSAMRCDTGLARVNSPLVRGGWRGNRHR